MSYLDLIDTVFDHDREVDHREIEMLRKHLGDTMLASSVPAAEANDLRQALVALEALSLLLKPSFGGWQGTTALG